MFAALQTGLLKWTCVHLSVCIHGCLLAGLPVMWFWQEPFASQRLKCSPSLDYGCHEKPGISQNLIPVILAGPHSFELARRISNHPTPFESKISLVDQLGLRLISKCLSLNEILINQVWQCRLGTPALGVGVGTGAGDKVQDYPGLHSKFENSLGNPVSYKQDVHVTMSWFYLLTVDIR